MDPRWGQEGSQRGQEGPTWSQNGAKKGPRWSQNGAKIGLQKTLKNGSPEALRFWAPKWPQNGAKNSSKLVPILEHFLDYFWAHFRGHFGCHFGARTGPGGDLRSQSGPNRSPRSEKHDFRKSVFCIGLSAFFDSRTSPRQQNEAQNAAKGRPERVLKPKKRHPKTDPRKTQFRNQF